MKFNEGFINIHAKGIKERFDIAWKMLRYGYIQFSASLLEDLAKSFIDKERKK